MNRERALKVVLVLVGLLFVGGIYPVTMVLWHANRPEATEAMMFSIYMTLGIFLLLAARDPLANRSLIAFTAWSSFAHAAVMFVQAFQYASERGGFLAAAAGFSIVGLALIVLVPARQSRELASTVGA